MTLSRLLRSATTVGGMTLISRVLGFVRDVVIARMFGASAEADAFFVAFKIPNFFRRLTAEGAFAQAFVPVLSDVRHQQGEESSRQLLNALWTRLSLWLAVLTVLGVIFAEPVMLLFAPGFSNDARLPLAVTLLQITFPYLLLISLTAMLASVLNTYERYWEPAFNPVWLNVSMIGAAFFMSPYLAVPIMSLAWGVLLAGMVQLLWVWWALTPTGWRPRWSMTTHEGLGRVWRNFLPAIFGVSVAQINLLVSTILASFLVAGSVSWLYYADRLMEFPVGILGVALATVVLPGLSKARAEGDWAAYNGMLDVSLRIVWVIGLPAMVALMYLAEPLMITLFAYGAFDARDAHLASQALVAYGVGLLALLSIKILAPAFYAREEMAIPVKVSVVALLVNLLMALLLIEPLAHVGLALAVSIAALVNALLLLFWLLKKEFFQPLMGWWKLWLQTLLSVLGMVAVVWWLESWLMLSWVDAPGLERGGVLLLLTVSGVLSYVVGLWVFGMRRRDWRGLMRS